MREFSYITRGLLIAAALIGLSAASAFGEVLTITLEAGDYEITADEQGQLRILMEDFGSLVQPGEPWLPVTTSSNGTIAGSWRSRPWSAPPCSTTVSVSTTSKASATNTSR